MSTLINFIPNDPSAVASIPPRREAVLPDRAAGQAGFTFSNPVSPGLFQVGTPEFLFLQCRQATLKSVIAWEQLSGAPLKSWSSKAADPKRLRLLQDAGSVLNAFYDRKSLSFFHQAIGSKTVFSGASTDMVAHEAGHAFLDVLRPEIFSANVTELDAFHEAFGDCMALLVALFDGQTRVELLKVSPDLSASNFVESFGEDLANAVRRLFGANHPAAAPRHSLNNLQYQLPTSLPNRGGPSVLTSEVHSFGRVFSGCFYDTLRNIFNRPGALKTPNALLQSAVIAGRLLITAAREAPVSARFFQSVGRAMVLADRALNNGAFRDAITRGFAAHNLQLGAASLLQPRVGLAGAAPTAGVRTARVSAATMKDVRRRIGAAPRSRMSMLPITLGEMNAVELVHERAVPLSGLSSKLKGVVALAPEGIVLGDSGGLAAAFSVLPDVTTTSNEVTTFVETLLAHDQIDFDDGATRKRGSRTRGGKRSRKKGSLATHHIVKRKGAKVLERARFACEG